MRMILISLLLSITTIACAGNLSDEGDWKFETLTHSQSVYINDDPSMDGMSVELSFMYPVSVSDGLDLSRVQNTFIEVLFHDFVLREQSDVSPKNPQVAFEFMVNAYVDEAEGYAKMYAGESDSFSSIPLSSYFQNRECRVSFQNEFIVTVTSSFSSYTGGAHGNYDSSSYNIDKRNGKVITEDLLYRPEWEPALSGLIQNVIAQRNSSEDENQHIGLYVDINEVRPNGNFRFAEQGISYYYGPYEIAPYAQGAVEIIIPYEQILPLVNKEYMTVVRSMMSE